MPSGERGSGRRAMGGPDDNPRSHRVADFIQRELASLIATELRDPRLSPMLTISEVQVSRDLSVATVRYSLLDSGEHRDTQAALERASGFLRRRLARALSIRAVPELRFRHDDSLERGARLSALIDEAVATNTTEADGTGVDEDRNAATGDAEPAGRVGEADPAADEAVRDPREGGSAG